MGKKAVDVHRLMKDNFYKNELNNSYQAGFKPVNMTLASENRNTFNATQSNMNLNDSGDEVVSFSRSPRTNGQNSNQVTLDLSQQPQRIDSLLKNCMSSDLTYNNNNAPAILDSQK